MNNRKRKGNSKSRNNGLKNFAVILVLAAVVGLIIFRITAQPANADSNDTSSRYKYYTSVCVESGDSLWSIAEEYITVDYENSYEYIEEVKEMNHLHSDFLKSGTRLCIPYYSSDYKA